MTKRYSIARSSELANLVDFLSRVFLRRFFGWHPTIAKPSSVTYVSQLHINDEHLSTKNLSDTPRLTLYALNSSCWLNVESEKICSSNWVHLPQVGVKVQNI